MMHVDPRSVNENASKKKGCIIQGTEVPRHLRQTGYRQIQRPERSEPRGVWGGGVPPRKEASNEGNA
jgi:hypothetical protein